MMGKTDRDQQDDQFRPDDRPDQLTATTGPPAAAPDPLPCRPAPARGAAHSGAAAPPVADLGMLARVRTALLQM
ncbi:MAG TPA: hypothetical protein VF070_28530 [Streptosporangiaceae bacterium]